MPAAEEELLLTDTQQAGHQRIQSLVWGEWTDRHICIGHFKFKVQSLNVNKSYKGFRLSASIVLF